MMHLKSTHKTTATILNHQKMLKLGYQFKRRMPIQWKVGN